MDLEISNLPPADPLTGTELFPVVQDGETRKSAVSTIPDLVGSQGPQGLSGAQGSQGSQGSQGTQGSQGSSTSGAPTEYFADLGSTTSFILNCANSVRAFRCNPTGNWIWSLTAVPLALPMEASGILVWLVVEVDNGAGKTSTLPSGGSWGVLGEPTWSSGVDIVTVYTRDGGTTSRWMLASPDA